ncbi:hypothetical protein Nepgr_018906 [Nepenthes gracilis]|uniref:Uncharacterized protein n=1 Tax=Nepenthes gracilis TaxID=150966 RepID=A0AAD3SUA1_NEPGR|nr:hypothetical protein Nepgr_018906 [Nepenthes gracilis]
MQSVGLSCSNPFFALMDAKVLSLPMGISLLDSCVSPLVVDNGHTSPSCLRGVGLPVKPDSVFGHPSSASIPVEFRKFSYGRGHEIGFPPDCKEENKNEANPKSVGLSDGHDVEGNARPSVNVFEGSSHDMRNVHRSSLVEEGSHINVELDPPKMCTGLKFWGVWLFAFVVIQRGAKIF